MGFLDAFSSQQSQYDNYQSDDAPHQATLSHELLGGAVAFEAAKAYEDHCARNGKPQSHALAKELFAGFAGAAVDRLVETKGNTGTGRRVVCAPETESAIAWLLEAQEQIQETFTEDVYESNY
ncbi:uncharacterized protein F5891DRAFT_974929 [Suillus fuscotomentosus]|uniref:Uncharacterized protein n=1 Tax=Suillus fuscotomentosus TaxID=1912939 RepID=A0AAD4HR91_9AGAM|nr:uncharacterized protein F5891DRAFT_974929 [Suillus fuscotomentosus]KAG1907155.1 hypothetical protein F5891DRAFT_974929 [Suillus fuscotomentosus]